MKPSTGITITDFFCGAGGSSTGARNAGLNVVMAANHWRLAIETHAANHPRTDHFCADLQATHPSLYPRTKWAWFSPECTNHTPAKGKRRNHLGQCDLWGDHGIDPAEERSRSTMREVVEFSAYHRYEVVFVENVVEVTKWHLYPQWLKAMHDLGYEHQTVYLNARFFNIAQSRDRWYTVFWKRGMKAPNLDLRPSAHCPKCAAMVGARQVWKNGVAWGRYGKNGQYIYACPQCGGEVFPAHKPARDIIDWALPCPPVGERKRPLVAKTRERIRAGLAKFAGETFVTSQYAGRDGKRVPINAIGDPLPTLTTLNNQQQLVMPPHIVVDLKNGGGIIPAKTTDAPLSTIATAQQHALVMTYYNNASWERVNEPLHTVSTKSHHALIIPDELVDDCGFRMLEPSELQLAMSFPKTYIILGSKEHQTKQIGNAVCCDVAQWLFERVLESVA